MNIRQLEIFLTVCETMSITEAAKQLYVSQPAISKTIGELETSIGILFFDRINGKLYLNEEGKAFRMKAKQLMRDFDDLENFNKYGGEEVPLKIGVSLTIAMNSLPYAIEQFKINYPRTPLKIYAENVQQVQRRLLNGEIDVAFTEGFESNQGFNTELLSEYSLFLVCSSNNEFVKKEKINREDLLKLPFLLREKGSTLRDCFDGLAHELKVDISPVLESINTEVLIRAAKAGMGITVLPEPLAIPYLNDGFFVRLHIEGHEMSTVNYAVMLKGKTKNKRHIDIIDCFKKAERQYVNI
ncbi:DNA-binding transcriptional LysR family regulator [Mobilisporobacter senegalensis]|uniref:DNA-binding transcriptional LysR family regulator n=1 Tax=Mobilisporobacter senegalensis TaxID=1329262 RepID=A0A3N1XZ33_9FIRM|nr:LysR family transcriptional regulator [Mobilisporobacter senegalensis]ROR31853.1 DNA-binding transcriptional LysR family regulator [Mobilisporobacter senegalensis]